VGTAAVGVGAVRAEGGDLGGYVFLVFIPGARRRGILRQAQDRLWGTRFVFIPGAQRRGTWGTRQLWGTRFVFIPGAQRRGILRQAQDRLWGTRQMRRRSADQDDAEVSADGEGLREEGDGLFRGGGGGDVVVLGRDAEQ